MDFRSDVEGCFKKVRTNFMRHAISMGKWGHISPERFESFRMERALGEFSLEVMRATIYGQLFRFGVRG